MLIGFAHTLCTQNKQGSVFKATNDHFQSEPTLLNQNKQTKATSQGK